jgi:hypothetical protein
MSGASFAGSPYLNRPSGTRAQSTLGKSDNEKGLGSPMLWSEVDELVGAGRFELVSGAGVEMAPASLPNALLTVEDLPTSDGEGGIVDCLPSATSSPFGTGSPNSFGAGGASSEAGVGASYPLGGA